MLEIGTRRKTCLVKMCTVGLSLALLVFIPTGGVQKAESADMGIQSRARAVAATVYEGNGIPDEMLPNSIDSSIADNAIVVSKDLVVTEQGEIKNIETGEPVTDEGIVGTTSKPADPLAKTGGRNFIPITVEKVKDRMGQSGQTQIAQPTIYRQSRSATMHSGVYPFHDDSEATALPVALNNNSYGAHWGIYNGSSAFFEADGTLFAQQAKGIIDVSQWQGHINWETARNSGVDGAIIRIGYGWGNGLDSTAQYNIRECKRLGIPFGIYLYSYAYDANTGRAEGDNLVDLLSEAGVDPGDLSYPIYYDLEKWVWKGHTPPDNPRSYERIVDSWYDRVQSAGYKNLSIYSYTSYLNTALNSPSIHTKTSWVASYGPRPGFKYQMNQRCWQYSDSGSVNGIDGKVDLNACGNLNYESPIDVRQLPDVTVPDGDYYINTWKQDSSSIDIPGGDKKQGTKPQIYHYNNSKAQQFNFTRQSDGSYVITNICSGLVLDVSNGQAHEDAAVWQYGHNGSAAQRWFVRDAGTAYYLQSALGNWVLKVADGSMSDYASVDLGGPDGKEGQRFQLASTDYIDTQFTYKILSALKGQLVFDIPGGSANDGVPVQLYNWNGSGAQLYRFTQVGNSIYEIVNANTRKPIEVASGQTSNGAAVQQYSSNGTQAQRWLIRRYGQDRYSLIGSASNKAIDVSSGIAQTGKKLQIYAQNGSQAQMWDIKRELTYREKLDQKANQHKDDLPDGIYQVKSQVDDSYCMDVSGGSKEDSALVQLYKRNGTDAQLWSVKQDFRGYKIITNVGSGKALDVAGGRQQNGASVQQYQQNGTDAQRWIAVRNENGSYQLVSALNLEKVLDLTSGITVNQNRLQLYDANGTSAQQWKISK